MGLVKTRRLAAMQKQQRAKAGLKSRPPKVTQPPRSLHALPPHLYKCGGNSVGRLEPRRGCPLGTCHDAVLNPENFGAHGIVVTDEAT